MRRRSVGMRSNSSRARSYLKSPQGGVKYRWHAIVGFLEAEQPEDEVALLGYAGFLEFFRATFDSESQELELTPNSRLPRAS